MGRKGPGEQAPRRFSSFSARLQSHNVLLPPQIVLGRSSRRATTAQTHGSKVTSQRRPGNSCVAVCVFNSSHGGLWVICTGTPAGSHIAWPSMTSSSSHVSFTRTLRVLGTVLLGFRCYPIAGSFWSQCDPATADPPVCLLQPFWKGGLLSELCGLFLGDRLPLQRALGSQPFPSLSLRLGVGWGRGFSSFLGSTVLIV